MIDININKLNKSFGFDPVLEDFNLEIKSGEKIALIGENGCGKSTLLKLITKLENPTSGTIAVRSNAKIGYLNQIPENEDIIVIDKLYKELDHFQVLQQRLLKLEKEITSNYNEKTYNRYLKAMEEFGEMGGYEIDEKVNKIIKNFKLENHLHKNYNNLSGGEKKLVDIATLMIQEPDIILLDEPTNHLDIETLEWFEQFLIKYTKTVLIISHDRYFLDKVVQKIVLIEDGKEIIFHGNYTKYLKENEERIEQELKNYKDHEKKIKALKDSIKRLREYGNLCGQTGGEIFFKRAKSMEKRLEKMDTMKRRGTAKPIPLDFKNTKKGSNDMVIIKDFNLEPLFDNLNLLIRRGDHVCMMGPNGCGKSTLIKFIQEKFLGVNVKYGYIPQIIDFEDLNLRVIDEAKKYFIGDEQHLRSALDKFLFGGQSVYLKLNSLSGGERVRLKLFCLIQENINFLILDEPTNHIDLETREILELALKSYDGTILFVSHDRYFINAVANKIVHFENKKLVEYTGDYDYFKSKNIK